MKLFQLIIKFMKKRNVGKACIMANLKEYIKTGEHLIDNEYGAMEYSKVSAMISLCNEMNLEIIVRIPEPKQEVIQNIWIWEQMAKDA